MGRLTLNVLLSFAQFEREVTAERIRDKIAASKKEGHVDGRARAMGLCHPFRPERSNHWKSTQSMLRYPADNLIYTKSWNA